VAGLAALLALFGWFLIEGITRFPALADDEGTYTAQAWAVRQFGQLTPYTYWYDHPPLGWIQLAGLTGLLDATGLGPPHGAVIAARYTMVVPALVSAALVYVIARRLDLRRPFALLAVAAFGLSPLALPLLRQVYLDGLALPWALAGFALSLDRRSRLWPSAGAGACLAVAVLSKETMLLLVPAAFLAARLRSAPRTRAFTLTALVMAFVLVVAGYGLLAVLKGELLPGPGHVSLLEAIRFQLVGRTGTGSGLVAGTRSNAMVAGWFSADPVLLGGGCLLAPVALLSRTLRPVAVALLVLIAVAARPGYLPAPYVLAVLPWCALLLAAAAQWLVVSASAAAGRAGRPAALVAVAVASVVVLGAVAVTGVAHAPRLAAVRTTDATGTTLAARDWVVANVDPRARILVDDTYFVDLADAGFEPGLGVVWFYKVDFTTNLDPSVVRALPAGYHSFDYVISSPIVRSALADSPGQLQEVRSALDASRPVATFGAGPDAVEVRRLVASDTGSGRIPPPVAQGAGPAPMTSSGG